MKIRLGLVCLFALGSVVFGGFEEPVAGKAVAELKLDKTQYFLGEPFAVTFILRNTDDKDISYSSGGDYRGCNRALRFRVQMVDADGKAVPDADPAMCMGGIGGTTTLKPGEEWRNPLLWPLDYLRLTKPGKYTLRVTHDLGWMGQEESSAFYISRRTADMPFVPAGWKSPIAEAQVEFLMLDERQAEKVLDAISAEIKKEKKENKIIPSARDLALPVYLPLLKKRALAGEPFFLLALGEIPTKDATLALLELAENKDFSDANAAAFLLSRRMPFPPHIHPNHRDEQQKRLLDAAWDESFTSRAREIAQRLVSSFDPDAPGPTPQGVRATGYFRDMVASEFKDVDLGARMLAGVGTEEDYEVLREALDKMLSRWMPPRRGTDVNIHDFPAPLPSLTKAVDALYERRMEPKASWSGNAELYLHFHRLAKTPPPRPKGWLEEAKIRWGSRYPINMAILESIPQSSQSSQPMPPECRELLFLCFGDSNNLTDHGVLSKACELAGLSGDTALLPEVLAVIRTENNEWLVRSATWAAAQLGARRELADALIERLPDEKLYPGALEGLVGLVMENLPNSRSGRTDLTRHERLALQAAWREWIGKHSADIEAGKKFPLGDDMNLPSALFGRAVSWTLPDGKTWPMEK